MFFKLPGWFWVAVLITSMYATVGWLDTSYSLSLWVCRQRNKLKRVYRVVKGWLCAWK